MKAKDIKDLISFISESGLDEVNIETEEIKLHIKKSGNSPQPVQSIVAAPAVVQTPPPVQEVVVPQETAPTVQAQQSQAPAQSSGEKDYISVKSPMIGTFYRSPSPDADVFVNVGDTIKEGQVVGIIEAMKLFNEIESEVSGKIVKVLVDNASPIEYDQPLFLIDPS